MARTVAAKYSISETHTTTTISTTKTVQTSIYAVATCASGSQAKSIEINKITTCNTLSEANLKQRHEKGFPVVHKNGENAQKQLSDLAKEKF